MLSDYGIIRYWTVARLDLDRKLFIFCNERR